MISVFPLTRRGVLGAAVLALALLLSPVDSVLAQGQAGAEGTLRPFWHVFLAFALAWGILFGWLVSIARRLGRVEGQVRSSDADGER